MKDPHCNETWNNFSKVLLQSWPDHIGTRKLPDPTWGGGGGRELMLEAWCLLKKDKEGLLPTPPSSFDYNNVTHWVLGGSLSLACLWSLQAPYSNKPLLVYHVASCWISSCTETARTVVPDGAVQSPGNDLMISKLPWIWLFGTLHLAPVSFTCSLYLTSYHSKIVQAHFVLSLPLPKRVHFSKETISI